MWLSDPNAESSSFHGPIYWAGFCELCAGITIEALKSDAGYAHVANGVELGKTASECSLCYLLKMALIVSARRLAPNIKNIDINTAFELLSIHAQKIGYLSRKRERHWS